MTCSAASAYDSPLVVGELVARDSMLQFGGLNRLASRSQHPLSQGLFGRFPAESGPLTLPGYGKS